MRDNGSLRGRLLGNLALLLVVLMLASGLSAYWNGREAADTIGNAAEARKWVEAHFLMWGVTKCMHGQHSLVVPVCAHLPACIENWVKQELTSPQKLLQW